MGQRSRLRRWLDGVLPWYDADGERMRRVAVDRTIRRAEAVAEHRRPTLQAVNAAYEDYAERMRR